MCESLGSSTGLSVESGRVADLTRTVDGLAELNRVKDDFVAMVSHELRTPLTAIRGYAKTLLRTDTDFAPHERIEFLEMIERNSGRLQRMIEDLLVVSRVESGTGTTVLSKVALADMLRQAVEGEHEVVSGRPVLLRVPESLPPVRTEPDKVLQVLANLIENARRYSPEGTPIGVSATLVPGGIDVVVENEGGGIPEEDRERVFERFYRTASAASAQSRGMGLGLYICRRLAEAIGGELRLQRSDERGTAFVLRIPLHHPAEGSDLPRLAVVSEARATSQA